MIGLMLAAAPHLAAYAHSGRLEFLADSDEVAYLAHARIPYYGSAVLRDPFSGAWESSASAYPWMLFVPLAKLAAALDIPVVLMGSLWRVVGGLLLGVALYLVFRALFADLGHRALWALGCAVIGLADAGFVDGHSLWKDATLVRHMVAGTTPLLKPDALPQYRVVTPILNLPFLLILVAAALPAKRRGRAWTVVGILALALTVYTYEYFWIAAAAALGLCVTAGLAVAWLSPPTRGAALGHARRWAVILIGGLILGAPQIYSSATAARAEQNEDFLKRVGVTVKLESSDPVRWRNARNWWVFGKLAVGAAGIVLLRSPALGLLWAFTFAGYALANSAIVTGRDVNNTHWSYVHCAMGEILLLAVLVGAAMRWFPSRTVPRRLLLGLAAALLLVAVAWRPYEALRAPSARDNGRLLDELRPLQAGLEAIGPAHALAGPAETAVAAVHTRTTTLYDYLYSWSMSTVPDRVLHERHALNAWLQGMDISAYETAARSIGTVIALRPAFSIDAVVAERVAVFERLLRGESRDLMQRYRPDYLLLPAAAPAPTRAGPWQLIGTSPRWSLWTRTAVIA